MASDIRPGDILLHMGTGQVSKLIAWAGNSNYSHAAVVLGGDTLAEAAAAGMRQYSLQARLQQTREFLWIDARRFVPNLSAAQLDAINSVARGYMGVAYALDDLVRLGLLCAFRDKVPKHPLARLLVRVALDRALRSDAKSMTCSEFVYRCFTEARTVPADALRPRIVIQPRAEPPFPDIDWKALWKEYHEAQQAGSTGSPALTGEEPALLSLEPPDPASVTVTEADLHQAAQAVRDAHGAPVGLLASGDATAADWPADPRPNPKSVEPGDLAASPNFAAAGRALPLP